jgi:hypothetical protein
MAKKAKAGGEIIKNLPWDLIFGFAEKMLANSQAKGASPEAQEKEIRDPSPANRKKLERFVKRKVGRAAWRDHSEQIMEAVLREGKKATPVAVRQFIMRVESSGPRVEAEEDDE